MPAQVANSPATSNTNSVSRELLRELTSSRPVKNKGVTISTPIASPSHQTRHADEKSDQACICVTKSVVIPMEAATIELTTAASITRTITARILARAAWK